MSNESVLPILGELLISIFLYIILIIIIAITLAIIGYVASYAIKKGYDMAK